MIVSIELPPTLPFLFFFVSSSVVRKRTKIEDGIGEEIGTERERERVCEINYY